MSAEKSEQYRELYKKWKKIRYKVYHGSGVGFSFYFFVTSKKNWLSFLKKAKGTNNLAITGKIKFIGYQTYLPIGVKLYSKSPAVWLSNSNMIPDGKREKNNQAKK